jgi:thiol:disulfide interchange protein
MRHLLSTLFFLFVTLTAWSQQPVKWTFSKKDLGNNQYELTFVGDIQAGWTVYSMLTDPNVGPSPTEVVLEKVPKGLKADKVVESAVNRKKSYDKVFEGEVIKFTKRASYTQKITISEGYNGDALEGYVYFMTCDDEKCMPPTPVEFSFKFPKAPAVAAKPAETPKKTDPATPTTTPIPAPVVADNLTDANPIEWRVTATRLTQDEYEVNFKALLKAGYFIYSQYSKDPKGPMPTTFRIDGEGDRLKTISRKETGTNKVRKQDQYFKMVLTKFGNEVDFTHKIKLERGSRKLKGQITYIVCNDKVCLPPRPIPFSVTLPTKMLNPPAPVVAEVPEQAVEPVTEQAADSTLEVTETAPKTAETEAHTFNMEYANKGCDDVETKDRASMSLLLIFLAGFGGGLVALLTPCVFPMLPLTVAFFTKQSKTKAQGIKNAVIYGLSIIGIYVGLGLAVTGFFGPDALNLLSTNAVMNLIFFALFVIFALSFFGLFEIQLPSSWANKSDSMADKGGLIGIFFMAFTLSLVSFSCTGPIIGTLLVEAARGGGPTLIGDYIPLRPLMGMFGFSLALALPFALFAAFPGWLNSLPRSGGWMNTVKISIGLLELALALKFLSVADMTYHWGILPIEIFLGAWIILFGILGLYLLGIIRFKSDGPKKGRINPIRALLGIVSLVFVGYLATGFNYEPLALLSGLAPPSHYNLFEDKSDQIYPDCPNGIRCFKDYDEGLAFAKKENLPIMIDFTGFGCVNCRKVEENVWVDENVKRILSKDYVLISLYVDDRKTVDTYLSPYSGRKIRNVGNKWADFQEHFFKEQSQPLYVLADNDGTVLHKPIGYAEAKNIDDYVSFLQCGLDRRASLVKEGLSKK